MKKKVLITLIAVILLLTGCAKGSSAFTVHPNRVKEQHLKTLLSDKMGLEIVDWMPLQIGGALAACKNSIQNDPDLTTYPFMEYRLCSFDGKTIESRRVYDTSMGKDGVDVYIFYDEDWESNNIVYKSKYIYVTGDAGTDVLVFVTPNFRIYSREKMTPADVEPWDTLQTKPMVLPDEDWFDSPIWIFDLSLDDIDESYELHYADWVLTGTDILNKTWQIGDAPIMQFP